MSTPLHTPEPSPVLIFQTMNAFQQTAALKAAIELDLFTAIGEGNATADKLAVRCQASERGIRILADYLTVIGFLTKADFRYSLTPDSAMFLDRRSPACMASAVKFLTLPPMTDSFKDLTAAVRRGGTVLSEHGTMEPEHPVWIEFARSMAPMMRMSAGLLAELVGAASEKQWKVLDIAAGHGLFGIAVAKRNPNAEIVAVDWPGVLEVAEENAHAAGVSGRYNTIPGSAFDVDYGSGFDLVLLTNFLHHFDAPTCETLLRKVHAALRPGGRAVTLEFVPNEDRISPAPAATFSMIMLGTTPSGDAYTFPEFEQMFQRAGFSRSELHPLRPTFQQAIISHR
jgi:2-polyprenyl-3-methyl-5-hydroxy-6-metoxy-1,4-benzoquinol methylase